jgi:hypothetical protein
MLDLALQAAGPVARANAAMLDDAAESIFGNSLAEEGARLAEEGSRRARAQPAEAGI